MNIWVEYWKKNNSRSLNNHAQMREQAHWVEPNPSDEIRVSMSFDFLFNRNISPEMNKFLVEIKAEKGHLFKAAW